MSREDVQKGSREGVTLPGWHQTTATLSCRCGRGWQQIFMEHVCSFKHTQNHRGLWETFLGTFFFWLFIFAEGIHLTAALCLRLQCVGDAWSCFLGWIRSRSKTAATARQAMLLAQETAQKAVEGTSPLEIWLAMMINHRTSQVACQEMSEFLEIGL